MNQNEIAKIAGITLKHPLMIFMREISIAGNYRFRVIVACATLELFITTLVKHHCKKHGGKFAKSSFERKLLLLHEMGILSNNRFRLQWQRSKNFLSQSKPRMNMKLCSISVQKWLLNFGTNTAMFSHDIFLPKRSGKSHR
jgi:hypothetical protein